MASFAKKKRKKRLLLAWPSAEHPDSHTHTFIKCRVFNELSVQHIKCASGACTDIKCDTWVSSHTERITWDLLSAAISFHLFNVFNGC